MTSAIALISKIAYNNTGNKALLVPHSDWGLHIYNCRSCSSLSAIKMNLRGILRCCKWANKNSDLPPWTFLSEGRWWASLCKWGGMKLRGLTWSPWSSSYSRLGLTWRCGRSLWGGAVGSRWAAGSLEVAVKQWDAREGAASSTL